MAALTALPAFGGVPATTSAQAGFALESARTSPTGRSASASDERFDVRGDGTYAVDSPAGGIVGEVFDDASLIGAAAALPPTAPAIANATSLAGNGIPEHTLRAYQAAAAALASADPTCRLEWTLLAGIGRVESNHGRFAGAIVSTAGVSIPAVIGIRLDGSMPKTVIIVDSDGGRLDGDTAYDRAVGPMQFLPGSWAAFGADGDGDGVRNPQDIDDAALAAGAFLCSGAVDLATEQGASAAVRRYNNSGEYVALVLSLADAYRSGFPVGAIPVVAPVGSVPVQPTTPQQPAAPPVVLGLPDDATMTDPPGTDQLSPEDLTVVVIGSPTTGANIDTVAPEVTPTNATGTTPTGIITRSTTTVGTLTAGTPTPTTGTPTTGTPTTGTPTTGTPTTGVTTGTAGSSGTLPGAGSTTGTGVPTATPTSSPTTAPTVPPSDPAGSVVSDPSAATPAPGTP